MKVRPITLYDLEWVKALVAEHFGTPEVVSSGRLHRARDLAGFAAVDAAGHQGLVQYRKEDQAFEVVVLIASRRGVGIGRRLLDEMIALGRSTGCQRLWLVTTNDNTAAQGFYEHLGWHLKETRTGAISRYREALKPAIAEFAADGTPIRDELVYELTL